MAGYGWKKFLLHGGLSCAGWLAVARFSGGGWLYAGWFAGFLGACYLLAGWFAYLRSKGSNPIRRLRRKAPPEVPYYLRGPEKNEKPRLSLGGNRHLFDDDEADFQEAEEAGLPKAVRWRLNSYAWISVGVLLLILSCLF